MFKNNNKYDIKIRNKYTVVKYAVVKYAVVKCRLVSVCSEQEPKLNLAGSRRIRMDKRTMFIIAGFKMFVISFFFLAKITRGQTENPLKLCAAVAAVAAVAVFYAID